MMKIRTISDLPEISEISESDSLMVSREVANNAWSSMKMTYKMLETSIGGATNLSVLDGINVTPGTDVGKRITYVDGLSAQVQVQPDYISFTHIPRISAIADSDIEIDDRQLTTRKDVIQMIDSNGERLSPASYVSIDPKNDQGSTQDWKYLIKIDSGKTDSELSENEETGGNYVVHVAESGWLVLYGCMASDADVMPQNAWVGLYVRGTVAGINNRWVLAQMQPWPMTGNSQVLQYVCFTVPVTAGSKFKVMTGFPVNGNNSGLQYSANSLLPGYNMPNTLVGYVIQNGEDD